MTVEIHRHERELHILIANHALRTLLPWPRTKQVDHTRRRLWAIEQRINEGCFIRSLESAFGVEATDEEWKSWFKILGAPIDRKSEDSKFIRRRRELNFLAALAKEQTALARALAEYSQPQYRQISFDLVRHLAENDQNIVLMYFLGHIAHIKVKNGKLVTASDHGDEVTFDPETLCDVLVFSKTF